MEYRHLETEKKWQKYWAENKTFAAEDLSSKPKYYVLDMFPYPSGAGLHVGHPLGYIASDIISRYKRHKGFNVLHPMGYDSFGLPAEQYAIQTGQHPEKTTKENIARYREQLDKIGFSFDWDREVKTSDPEYYRWTQWIFLQLFNSWYNPKSDKAENLNTLISIFEKEGFRGEEHEILTGSLEKDLPLFSADEWKNFSEEKQQHILMHFRLAYLSEAYVNWCPQLGTVLANDEVKDGVSERGGYPVERKLMKQWSMRITAYADRLLNGLNTIDWSESIKEAQRNWIGKSEGASIAFKVQGSKFKVEVFTTRPDTLFGVSYLTLAPESDLVNELTTPEQKEKAEAYVTFAKNRSERERQADVKNITGVFTGSYAIHPFTKEEIPIWIGDYVLAGYGTGAVMAVPAHDTRDFAFAKHFGLPMKQVVETPEGWDLNKEAYDEKSGKIINSDFLNRLDVKTAITKCISEIEKIGAGKGKINFRLRDAVFGRQRYWGEPIPIYYKNGIPYGVDEDDLPVTLPEVDKYLPTEDGEPPLARANNWKYKGEFEYETTTMPGWAGSSWYFLRYMDANNKNEFASNENLEYWKEIDLYIGGAEHATGHLLYFRFWTKFLKDLGYISIEEPAKKLINQGMIQGVSAYLYFFKIGFDLNNVKNKVPLPSAKNYIVSKNIAENYIKNDSDLILDKLVKEEIQHLNQNGYEGIKEAKHLTKFSSFLVDISCVDSITNELNIEEFKKTSTYKNLLINEIVCEADNSFYVYREVEKMSKSKLNVLTPDDICEKFGADTLRLYEMFLGPLEDHKPWNTNGIEGVNRFLKKLCRLFENVSNEAPTKAELKSLHKCIKKVNEEIERYSFNTVVSTYMICVNELGELKCSKKEILEQFVILLSPYAPHLAEELWEKLGHNESISTAPYPTHKEEFLIEDNHTYPVQFNGKLRFNIELPLTLTPAEIEKIVLESAEATKYLEGKTPKKVIVVPKKIVNVVI
jgi:leucyl-tRNA synthetase